MGHEFIGPIDPPSNGKSYILEIKAMKHAHDEKVVEFKFNMIQFSVVEKVDFFKQTSELIWLDVISTFVSKDKLQRDFKKLENKLKTESAEKKELLIKKIKLENKIKKISKGKGK